MRRTTITCDYPGCKAKIKDATTKNAQKYNTEWRSIAVRSNDGGASFVDVCPVHSGNVFWIGETR